MNFGAAILILCKNEESNIGSCLDAVFSQDTSLKFEVVVVDSGSTDDTLAIASRYPIRLFRILPEEFHHARTRNYAASLTGAPCLVYLAADAKPADTRWLEALTRDFSDPEVGAVYGRQMPKPGSTIEREIALASIYEPERLIKSAANKAQLGYRYYMFSTVNAAIRRTAWEMIPFPEELKVFEDVGWAKPALDSGWKIVYEPHASVWHSHNFSNGKLFKRYFDIGAVYQQLNIWDESARRSLVRDGVSTVARKFSMLGATGSRRAVRHGLLQSAVKYIGIMLGRNQRFLPLALKRRLSAFRLYD